MAGVQGLLRWVILGSVLAPLTVVLMLIVTHTYGFFQRLSEDCSHRRKLRLTVRYLPREIRYDTNWYVFGQALLISTPVGGITFAVLYVQVAGILEVFL